MFFISPIKTLYSIKFYLQTLKEPLWKAFCFVLYLFVLGAIFLSFYTPLKLKQPITSVVEQTINYIPNIKVNNGIITANDNKRLVISPKELQGAKIIIDTGSAEPAYPTQMQKENILLYINKDTVYGYDPSRGRFEAIVMQKDLDLEISKDGLTINKQQIDKQQIVKFITYLLTITFILVLAFYLAIFSVIALILALIINAVTKANLDFKKLLTLALYLQGPVFVIYLILSLLPITIVGMSVFLAILIFVIYLNLIFFHLRANIMQRVEVQPDEDEE